jgi:SAM-dependent methyltransferase
VPTIEWGEELADVYDRTYDAQAEEAIVRPMVALLAEVAGGGRALELAVGTGRVALPLAAAGVPVEGIELSSAMAEKLRAKAGADHVAVTIGDMTSTRVEGAFSLVYIVANSIMNVTTQEEQLATVRNAADHLRPGGHFVIELIVPQLQRVPRGERGHVFQMSRDHVGIETFDDVAEQIAWSHHWMHVDGTFVHHAAPYRYIWPPELDLMARLAGLERRDRWGDWDRSPFTSECPKHVTVYEKPA